MKSTRTRGFITEQHNEEKAITNAYDIRFKKNFARAISDSFGYYMTRCWLDANLTNVTPVMVLSASKKARKPAQTNTLSSRDGYVV